MPSVDLQPSARLFRLTVGRCLPLSFTAEITYRCPLSCRHCYLPETQGAAPAREEAELSTREWERFLGELAEAGCLYLVLTGGEPLLRPDAAQLASRARALGFDIRLYTTGLGLTPRLADELAALSLGAVELSVYGRPGTHDGLTRRPGSYGATLRAAGLLAERGVPVVLKCPLMHENCRERHYLLELGRELGAQVKFDPTLAPRNDRGRGPLGMRMTPGETLEVLHDEAVLPAEKVEGPAADYDDASFLCGAGRNIGGIDPYGNVYPCMQLPLRAGNIREAPLRDIWRGSPALAALRGWRLSDVKGCSSCGFKPRCARCPGIALLEDGDALGPSSIACAITQARYGGNPT